MKAHVLTILAGCALIAVFLAGCSAPVEEPAPTTTPTTLLTVPPTPIEPSALIAGTWTLTLASTGTGALTPMEGTTITATFLSDGTVSGSAGCNNYVAAYQVSANGLRAGKPATTKMSCRSPTGIMNQETIYLSNLQGASTYTLKNDQMMVYDSAGKLLLVFRKGGPDLVPHPLGGITWNLEFYRGSSGGNIPALPGTDVTALFGPSGEVTGSAGCNSYSGKFTSDGQSGISIGPLATTLMYCNGTGVMDQESAYLTLLQKAAAYKVTNTGELVLSDRDGTILLRYLS